MKIFKSLTDS